jgi:hypothetical protein
VSNGLPDDWHVPDELILAVDHIDFLFADAWYRVSLTTKGLCYAMLHPDTAVADRLAEELDVFAVLLRSIEPTAEDQIRDLLGFGTPPAVLKAFFEAQCALLRIEGRRLFDELMQVGNANKALLQVHPITWAQTHALGLINGKDSSAERWVIDALDVGQQDLSGPIVTDLIESNAWRAPKLLDMHPAGSIPYNPETAWEREDEAKTQGLLDTYVGTMVFAPSEEVFDLAGSTAITQAKQGEFAGTREDKSEQAVRNFDELTVMLEGLTNCESAIAVEKPPVRPSKIRSGYKIAIREGLINVGLDASAQAVATWISEECENTEFPHITSRYGDRSDIGQLCRTNRKFRAQFARDVTDMRKLLKKSPD